VKSFVYCTTNVKSGKRYVGKANNPTQRWVDHIRRARQSAEGYLTNTIRKWGVESFKLEVVQEHPSEKAAFEAEAELTRVWETNNSQ
jgi:predicted GIY-YIG superfamily endonuclease